MPEDKIAWVSVTQYANKRNATRAHVYNMIKNKLIEVNTEIADRQLIDWGKYKDVPIQERLDKKKRSYKQRRRSYLMKELKKLDEDATKTKPA